MIPQAQQQQIADTLEHDAQVVSNSDLENRLAREPEAVRAEVTRINHEATRRALQVALALPLLAGALGLLNSFRMLRFARRDTSASVKGAAPDDRVALQPRRQGEAMLRRLTDLPAGTIGFEAIGEVEDDDWEKAVEPVLRNEIAEGRDLRLLYVLGPQSRDVEGDALAAGAGFRARHVTSFERVAVVSDEDWVRPALRALSVLLPGKTRGFRVRDLDAAKAWLVEDRE